ETRHVRTRTPRFRLSLIGFREIAGIHAGFGLIELLLQHVFVVALNFEYRLVAQDVKIGIRGIEEQLLLGIAQFGAAAINLLFGRFRFGIRAETAENRLRYLHAITMRGIGKIIESERL